VVNANLADGSICLIDERGPRIVADGFKFSNEIRLDGTEEWLYVAETTGKRVTRMRVQPDGVQRNASCHTMFTGLSE
jgi:sugar lactone lactonase YvrE